MEVIEQKSIEFVPTKQGGMKLLCDGRLYHLRKKYSNGKLYQCYNLRGCRGNVTLDSENKIIKGKPNTVTIKNKILHLNLESVIFIRLFIEFSNFGANTLYNILRY